MHTTVPTSARVKASRHRAVAPLRSSRPTTARITLPGGGRGTIRAWAPSTLDIRSQSNRGSDLPDAMAGAGAVVYVLTGTAEGVTSYGARWRGPAAYIGMTERGQRAATSLDQATASAAFRLDLATQITVDGLDQLETRAWLQLIEAEATAYSGLRRHHLQQRSTAPAAKADLLAAGIAPPRLSRALASIITALHIHEQACALTCAPWSRRGTGTLRDLAVIALVERDYRGRPSIHHTQVPDLLTRRFPQVLDRDIADLAGSVRRDIIFREHALANPRVYRDEHGYMQVNSLAQKAVRA